jgi:hypothetical protein
MSGCADNRATVLNLASNNIMAKRNHACEFGALSHAIGLSGHGCDECGQPCPEAYQCLVCNYDCCPACNISECPVVALVNAIKDMAVSKLNLSMNGIITREAGKALAGMLKANSVLTELDISDCGKISDDASSRVNPGIHIFKCGSEFAQELAVGISGNEALTSLNISNCALVPEPMCTNGHYEDPNISGKEKAPPKSNWTSDFYLFAGVIDCSG